VQVHQVHHEFKGHGYCGRDNNKKMAGRGQANRKGKLEAKKSLTDYNYYIGSAKQASDYETTTQFLINYIKKMYEFGNDIGMALKNLEEVNQAKWKPTMAVSTATEEAEKIAQNQQFEIKFKANYDSF
jgi:hypothetical protein